MNVQAMLGEWGMLAHGVTICNPQTQALPLQKFTFAEAGRWVNVVGNFANDCEIWLNPAQFPAGAKIPVNALNPVRVRRNIKLVLLSPAAGLQIFIGGDDCRVFVGATPRFVLHAMLWGGADLVVGDEATCNGARTVQRRSSLIIGRDAMLSDEILLQGAHQHTLVDLTTMQPVHKVHETCIIGEHVWIGRRAMVMPGVHIGKGAMLAAGAVASRDMPECSMAAGVPAEIMRVNVSWCRNEQNEVNKAELAAAGIGQP